MKITDYCLGLDGSIYTKASLYLEVVHHAQTGDIVQGGVFEFPGADRPTFEEWAKIYTFEPIPTGLWEDFRDIYKQ